MKSKPVYKRCPICKRKYLCNPDIGQILCPYCGKKGIPGMDELPELTKKVILKNERQR